MSVVIDISEVVLADLGRQIGELIAPVFPQLTSSTKFEIRETFLTAAFGADALNYIFRGVRELRGLIDESLDWHHQIFADGSPVAFARSVPHKQSSLRTVTQVFATSAAANIDSAIDRVDEYGTEKLKDVLLLTSVPLQLYAFWLVGNTNVEDKIVIASQSSASHSFQNGQVLSSIEFSERISSSLHSGWLADTGQRLAKLRFPRALLRAILPKVAMKRIAESEVKRYRGGGRSFNWTRDIERHLGRPGGHRRFSARFVYCGSRSADKGVEQSGFVTTQSIHPRGHLKVRYRLYYEKGLTAIQEYAHANDALFMARDHYGMLNLIVVNGRSRLERQMLWLFGMSEALSNADYDALERNCSVILDLLQGR